MLPDQVADAQMLILTYIIRIYIIIYIYIYIYMGYPVSMLRVFSCCIFTVESG